MIGPRDTSNEFRLRQKKYRLCLRPTEAMTNEMDVPLVHLVWVFLYFDHNLPTEEIHKAIDGYLDIVRDLPGIGVSSAKSNAYLESLWAEFTPYFNRELAFHGSINMESDNYGSTVQWG